jgi:hypothetical protein
MHANVRATKQTQKELEIILPSNLRASTMGAAILILCTKCKYSPWFHTLCTRIYEKAAPIHGTRSHLPLSLSLKSVAGIKRSI